MKQHRTTEQVSRKFLLRLSERLWDEVERQANVAGCSINNLLNQIVEYGVTKTQYTKKEGE